MNMTCEQCGRTAHEDCFAIFGERVLCDVCREMQKQNQSVEQERNMK